MYYFCWEPIAFLLWAYLPFRHLSDNESTLGREEVRKLEAEYEKDNRDATQRNYLKFPFIPTFSLRLLSIHFYFS